MRSCVQGCLAVVALVATGLVASPAAFGDEGFATATPEQTIGTLHAELVAAAAAHPGDAIDARYEQLLPAIRATHDLAYIAEFALRRQWPSLSADERTRFIAAFERLSVMTYAARFARVTAQTFTLGASEPAANGRVEVATSIARAEGDPVPLEYLLEQRDGAYRIINIVADGVSDLALKRAEYQRVLAEGTIDKLIADLDEQTRRLR